MNGTDIYVIGGTNDRPNLLSRKFEVSKTCLKIDIKSGEITERSQMIEGRCDFGFCHIGQRIYVCGGYSDEEQNVFDCTAYDVLRDHWTRINADIPDTFSTGITVQSL